MLRLNNASVFAEDGLEDAAIELLLSGKRSRFDIPKWH